MSSKKMKHIVRVTSGGSQTTSYSIEETPRPTETRPNGVWKGLERFADNIADQLPIGNYSESFDSMDASKAAQSQEEEESVSDVSGDSSDSSMYSFGNTTVEFSPTSRNESIMSKSMVSSVSDSTNSQSPIVPSSPRKESSVPKTLRSTGKTRTAQSAVTCDIRSKELGGSRAPTYFSSDSSSSSIPSSGYDNENFVSSPMAYLSPHAPSLTSVRRRNKTQKDERTKKSNSSTEEKPLSPRSMSKVSSEANREFYPDNSKSTSYSSGRQQSFNTDVIRTLANTQCYSEDENEIIFDRAPSRESVGLFNDSSIWNKTIYPTTKQSKKSRKIDIEGPAMPVDHNGDVELIPTPTAKGKKKPKKKPRSPLAKLTRLASPKNNTSSHSKWDKKFDDLFDKVKADDRRLHSEVLSISDETPEKPISFIGVATKTTTESTPVSTHSPVHFAHDTRQGGLGNRIQRIKSRQRDKRGHPATSPGPASTKASSITGLGALSAALTRSPKGILLKSPGTVAPTFESPRNANSARHQRSFGYSTEASENPHAASKHADENEKRHVFDRFTNNRKLASLSTCRVTVPEADGDIEVERRSPRTRQKLVEELAETKTQEIQPEKRRALFRKAKNASLSNSRLGIPVRGEQSSNKAVSSDVFNIRTEQSNRVEGGDSKGNSNIVEQNMSTKNVKATELPTLVEESSSLSSSSRKSSKQQAYALSRTISLVDADAADVVTSAEDSKDAENQGKEFHETIRMDGNRSFRRVNPTGVPVIMSPNIEKTLGSAARPIKVDERFMSSAELHSDIRVPSEPSVTSEASGPGTPHPDAQSGDKATRKKWKKRVGKKITKLTSKFGGRKDSNRRLSSSTISDGDLKSIGDESPNPKLMGTPNSVHSNSGRANNEESRRISKSTTAPQTDAFASAQSLPVQEGSPLTASKLSRFNKRAQSKRTPNQAQSSAISTPGKKSAVSDTFVAFGHKRRTKISFSPLKLRKGRSEPEARQDGEEDTRMAQLESNEREGCATTLKDVSVPIPEKLPRGHGHKNTYSHSPTTKREKFTKKLERAISLKPKTQKKEGQVEPVSLDDGFETNVACGSSHPNNAATKNKGLTNSENLDPSPSHSKKRTVVRVGKYQCKLPASKSNVLEDSNASEIHLQLSGATLSINSVTESEQDSMLLTPQSTCRSTESGITSKSKEEKLARVERKLAERLAVDLKILSAMQHRRAKRHGTGANKRKQDNYLKAVKELGEEETIEEPNENEKDKTWTGMFRRIFSCN